jgi:hypothetical protein
MKYSLDFRTFFRAAPVASTQFSRMIFMVILLISQLSFVQASSKQEKQLIEENLEKFEVFVAKAKENGATHVRITDNIPHSFWQFDTEGDPYPAWYIHQPTLFKIFTPDKLKPYMNMEYAEKVASIFEERCKILRRHGLKAYYFATEPALLPEKFYTDNPELRGARVDHPNRSKVARFAPCVDTPEILALYREAMLLLQKRCPEIELITLFTSDSGSGFCWAHGLYAGRNGNSNCQHRPMAERIAGLLITLQQAAKEVGTEVEINMQPIHPRQWMGTIQNQKQIAATLPKGLTLSRFPNASGETFDRGKPGWSGYTFSPVIGLTNPLQNARSLLRRSSNMKENSRLIVSNVNPESMEFNLGLYEHLTQVKVENYAQMLQELRNYAIKLAGDQGADDLLQIWLALDRIANDLRVLNFGSILRFGPILTRWINRPLVPFPEELSPEDIAYYRPFLFQAKGEKQANNLIDIQAMRPFEGYGARLLVQRVYEMVMANLTKAQKLARSLHENEIDPSRKEEWNNLVNRLAVLHSLVQTIDNVVAYQALLDLVHSRGVKPEENPVLGVTASWDRQEIQRIARNEIDNAARLKRLLESSKIPLIHTAKIPEYESIRVLGPDLPSQLKRKIDIMNKHWLDYNRLYTAPNL